MARTKQGDEVPVEIERWFAGHSDDSEFDLQLAAAPYSVVAPSDSNSRIIFTTKPHLVSTAIHYSSAVHNTGVIGRAGLPRTADLKWITRFVGERPLLFLGDLDPVDLLVYAWLHSHLKSQDVCYLGVSDDFISANQIDVSSLVPIPFTVGECESMTFLVDQVFPTLGDIVGNKCRRILLGGKKIELESVVSARKGGLKALVLPDMPY